MNWYVVAVLDGKHILKSDPIIRSDTAQRMAIEISRLPCVSHTIVKTLDECTFSAWQSGEPLTQQPSSSTAGPRTGRSPAPSQP